MTAFKSSDASYNTKVDQVDFILANMDLRASPNSKTGVLLQGEPGTGKTSFIKTFAQLMGMTLITIEAPHISEEHIINIPFIVFDQKLNKHGETEVDVENYNLVLADSHLYSALTEARKIPDNELLQLIYGPKGTEDNIKIWEKLGGTSKIIAPQIDRNRKRTKVILFIDEFFRQNSPNIRNMLRGILNGKLGSHDLPKDVYVIYASNLESGAGATGITPIQLNMDFKYLTFGTPEKDDWFGWLISKYKSDKYDTKVELKPEIVDKFHKLIDQDMLNHKSELNELIRVSPRRWEQILLYVNAALPCNNMKDAKGLMTNIRSSFKDYESGEHSEITDKVMQAVSELIDETSNISISSAGGHSKADWKDTIEHQVAMKKKLGEHRSYVPIISGAPGVGKTTFAYDIAEDQDLRLIYIDCSTFSSDDINGIPLSKKKDDGGIKMTFSLPKLYDQIMKDCAVADKAYKAELISGGKKSEAANYDRRAWKYLIFFDEMNRVKDIKVFNALRRVVLEKDFGDDLALPKEAIVIAAINPKDLGTVKLTGHMRDVVDVIDISPSWAKVTKHINGLSQEGMVAPEMTGKILDAVKLMSETFKTKDTSISRDESNFHLAINDKTGETVYISPREYQAMIFGAITHVNIKLERLLPKLARVEDDEERKEIIEQVGKQIRQAVWDIIEGMLANILKKQKVESPEFMRMLKIWIFNLDTLDIMVTEVATMTFNDIMGHYYGKENAKDLSNEQEFISYLKNVKDSNTFATDISDFLERNIVDDEEIIKSTITKNYPKKTLKDGVVEWEETEVTKIEHFIREMIHAVKLNNLSNTFSEAIALGVGKLIDALIVRMKGRKHEIITMKTFSSLAAALTGYCKVHGIKLINIK